jgi:hypothetical protein
MSTHPEQRSQLLALLLGMLLALGALAAWRLFGLPLPGRPSAASAPESEDLRPVLRALEALDARLARMESASAVQASRGERVAQPADDRSGAAAKPQSEAPGGELQQELARIEQRLDLLAKQLEGEQRVHFEIPTIAQVRAARREVDWSFLSKVAEIGLDDNEAGTKLMRLMTFDDVLARIGVPDMLWPDNPWWDYLRPANIPGRWSRVRLVFVGDCVSKVDVAPLQR